MTFFPAPQGSKPPPQALDLALAAQRFEHASTTHHACFPLDGDTPPCYALRYMR